MDRWKKLLNKITGGTKLRKDQLLVMILCGILLCVVAVPFPQKDSSSGQNKSGISDSDSGIMEGSRQMQNTESVSAEPETGYDLSYTDYWEGKLEEALSTIEGAGSVEVLITLKESEEKILEKDIPQEIKQTQEQDAEGGSRTVTENRLEESTVFTVNEAGQDVPYVRKTIQPVVEGVVVIVQGADSEMVKENIIETIKVLFGIDTNKIRVVKRKSNKS
ncbi:MAG: stage III sporulation protein AG [Ruminococcus sp.]|nr:stage III sporulation protein AG [Ruminococcus sp.]